MGFSGHFVRIFISVLFFSSSLQALNSSGLECVWPLALEGRKQSGVGMYGPAVSRNWDFLKESQYGMFNLSPIEWDEIFAFDELFIEQLVMGNVLYEAQKRQVFLYEKNSTTRAAASKFLQMMASLLVNHSDDAIRSLYQKKASQLSCLPLGKKFSLDNPREHPLAVLGRLIPDDVLIVELNGKNKHRLVGGFVAFPSGWRLSDRIGQTLNQIHANVYEVEEEEQLIEYYKKQMESINKLFDPEQNTSVQKRNNWFIYDDPSLAQFPDRRTGYSIPIITEKNAGDTLFLRLEREVFIPFVADGKPYLAMLLRPFHYRLRDVVRYPRVAERLAKGLQNKYNAYRGHGYNEIVLSYMRKRLPWLE